MLSIAVTQKLISRFWAKVNKGSSENGCWLWTGKKFNYGRPKNDTYGAIKIGGKFVGAHRVSYVIANGNIADGRFVCHKCDTPLCVNPSHLFLGTPKENVTDAIQKGRLDNSGAGNGMSRLTENDVLEIKRLLKSGLKQKEIAAKFGISRPLVSGINTGYFWGSVRNG